MEQESGSPGESYSSVLWGSRGWQDLHKVQEYSSETIGGANEELNQFVSNRHLMRGSPWTEYRGSISLLRLPDAEGPIGGKRDRKSA